MKKYSLVLLSTVGVLALAACGGAKKVSYETYMEKAEKAFVVPEADLEVKVTYSVKEREDKDEDFNTRGETRYGIATEDGFSDGFFMAATDVLDPEDPAGGAELGATYAKKDVTFYVNPFKAVYDIEVTAIMEQMGMVGTVTITAKISCEFNSKGWLTKSEESVITTNVITMEGEVLGEVYEEEITVATLEYGHFND